MAALGKAIEWPYSTAKPAPDQTGRRRLGAPLDQLAVRGRPFVHAELLHVDDLQLARVRESHPQPDVDGFRATAAPGLELAQERRVGHLQRHRLPAGLQPARPVLFEIPA